MKKLLYIMILMFLMLGCSKREKPKEEEVYVAPDSVWDYSSLDSIDREIKAYSYRCYGDSNLLEEGLPDSMKLKNE